MREHIKDILFYIAVSSVVIAAVIGVFHMFATIFG